MVDSMCKMYRSAMQVFVKDSGNALKFYEQAFDAAALSVYPNTDGTLMHSELDVYGQIMMVSELVGEEADSGNTMMYCLHFGKGKESVVTRIYEKLKDGARIVVPLEPCVYSPLMFDLIDKYRVRWCVFI